MIDYSELTAEELAEAYATVIIEKRNIAERESQIKAELTDKLIDKEPDETGLYRFSVGAFKLTKAGVKETWDKDAITRDLYRMAVQGTTHTDALGEIQGEAEYRVFDSFIKSFSITPRKTALRGYGFDVDEYISKEGEGQMTVRMVD